MKGDYYRYLAEVATGEDREGQSSITLIPVHVVPVCVVSAHVVSVHMVSVRAHIITINILSGKACELH